MWLAHVLVLHVVSTIMLLLVTASPWRRQVQASFFCFYHACVIAVSDLGVPQRVRRKQFHHGQLSMLLSFKICQHTSHNVRIFARRFTRIQCFRGCYWCSTAQHYQQLASHSFFSDEVGDCARSHDVVMCGSHSIEPGTCDNYGGPGAAIYCNLKAQEIRWKYPCKFQNVALRMGCLPHSYRLPGGSWQAFWWCWSARWPRLTKENSSSSPQVLLEYNNDTQIDKDKHKPTHLHKSSSQIFTNSQIFFFF